MSLFKLSTKVHHKLLRVFHTKTLPRWFKMSVESQLSEISFYLINIISPLENSTDKKLLNTLRCFYPEILNVSTLYKVLKRGNLF